MADQTKQSRRKLLKSIAIGGGVFTTAKALPGKWTKPVVDSVLLPVHAVTTGVTYSIFDCDVVDLAEPECGEGGIGFQISGSVSASDGSDLSGVLLNVAYTNEIADPPPGDATVNFQTAVQAGNIFSDTFTAVPPVSEVWNDPTGTVVVTFLDQGTYGPASCSEDFECETGGMIGP